MFLLLKPDPENLGVLRRGAHHRVLFDTEEVHCRSLSQRTELSGNFKSSRMKSPLPATNGNSTGKRGSGFRISDLFRDAGME